MRKKMIYLDYAAGAPLDQEILLLVQGLMKDFGNASALHSKGVFSRKIIEEARKKIASLLKVSPSEIIFNSCGSESNNLAILGVIYNFLKKNKEKKPHIITTILEHPSVYEAFKYFEKTNQAEVSFIQPNKSGIIEEKEIKKYLKKNTILVSVMYVNNEIGTIQPIKEIAKIIKHFRKENNSFYPLFHTDAIQGVNSLNIEIPYLGVDLMTLNSTKIYGPAGSALLYKRKDITIDPLIKGGGQEFDLRPGTENMPAIFGFAKALEKTYEIKEKENKRMKNLHDFFIKEINKNFNQQIKINGDLKNKINNIVSVKVQGLESEILILELDARGICVSSQSACKKENKEFRIIKSIDSNFNPEKEGIIRFSFGRKTQIKDLIYTIKALREILNKYKKINLK